MAESSDTNTGWSSMARETFEYNLVPWAGRKYVEWMRAWARPHPGDPRGLVQVRDEVFQAFQKRLPGQHLSRQTVESLGYPSVPGERELRHVRQELHDALLHGNWEHAHDLDEQVRELTDRVATTRATALRARAQGT